MFKINYIKNLFVPKTMKQRALDRIQELESERFEAILNKIQWEYSIHSKVEQLEWLNNYLEDIK